MTFLCLSGILGSAADKMPVTPIREAAGFVIIPFQNGINQIGAYLTDCLTGFQNVKKLSAEKEEPEQKVTDLTEEKQSACTGSAGAAASSGAVSAGPVLLGI